MDNFMVGTCSDAYQSEPGALFWDAHLFANMVLPFVDDRQGVAVDEGENNMNNKAKEKNITGFDCESYNSLGGGGKCIAQFLA
jgi:hypothetical protein